MTNTGVYNALVLCHAWFGWIAIASAVVALVTSAPLSATLGVRVRRGVELGLTVSLTLQVVTGVLLHLRFSPFTAFVRANVEVVLRDPTLRYWNVVHPALGILSFAIVVCRAILVARSRPDRSGRRSQLLWLVSGLALMLAAMPWTD